MKRILASIFFALMVISSSAQDFATLKFMGVPVDGDRLDFIFQLKKKGFSYDSTNRVLTGKFNGVESNIFVNENNGKVDRVMVCDANTIDKRQIKIRFNNLLGQFNRNDKYLAFKAEPIPDDEDISYEMLVNDKEYSATFLLNPYHEFSDEEKDKLTSEINKRIDGLVSAGYYDEDGDLDSLADKILMMSAINDTNGMVWFRIDELRGEYGIYIYYDNLKNRPNGEDL